MSVNTVFRFEDGKFLPYDKPWGDPETLADTLKQQGFRKEVCLTLGRPQAGIGIEVHEAEDLNAPYLDYAFLALIRIGETPHPVFCRDLPALLDLCSQVIPLIEFDLKCAEREADLPRNRAHHDK